MTSLRKGWTQRDAEAFFRARRALNEDGNVSHVELNGNTVRAAAAAGLIDGFIPGNAAELPREEMLLVVDDAVGGLRPAAVVKLAQEIDDALREAFDLSGE